jgi:hypothetical protein
MAKPQYKPRNQPGRPAHAGKVERWLGAEKIKHLQPAA